MFETIRDIIAKQLDLDPESITPESRLLEDLHADSLDIVEFITTMESEFDIDVPEDAINTIHTVGDAVKLLDKK
ncbi:MAG TPA: acyl carrier protein [Eubacteriales bacterium]|jgi:acyl carrier protein|nr:acyl carrier protein [Clostridia bacterium]HRV72297.1 acyl carrier protein [Eubacteriales bacterium]